MTGANTIDGASGTGLQITNASGTFSNITFGANSAIGGAGIQIANSDATSRTVALSSITMGSGGAGDTGDVGGIGVDINSSGSGVLTVNLTGTNFIRSTGQALDADETNGALNRLLLSIDNTTFESNAAGVPTVEITGQNVSTTTSSVGVRSFSGNAVRGNGTGGGILFTAVDFDGDGAGTAVSAGTLNIGQLANFVQGDGLSLIDTTGELTLGTLSIYNNGGTGLEVDTKTNGFNTDFTLNGGGSGTILTTNGAALWLDPLTMNLSFGSVTSTNSGGNGVFIDGAAKGQTYEGEWADDAMAGRGAFRYATSAKYEGEFLNNQYQGHGTYTFPSGAVYDGPFVENQMHGEGTYTDEHGVQWKGTFYMGSGPGLPGHASAQAS